MNRNLILRVLLGALLLLFLTCVSYGAGSSGQIRFVSVSPDGKLLAIEFQKGDASFILRFP